MIVRAAVIQAEVARGRAAALEHTAALTHDAVANGAQLVVFPETWIPGYPIWLDVCRDVALWDSPVVKDLYADHAANSVDVAGADGAALARIARDAGVTLVVGVVERVSEGPSYGTLFNALLTYGPDGTLLNHHRKLVPTYTERLLWGPGDASGLHAAVTPVGRIGGLVCWEHWMPLARQALHESGEDIHVAAWPTVHDMHQIASRHYAFEGRCFVLAAGSLGSAAGLPPTLEPHPARVASADALLLRGGSAIIGPDGAYRAGPVFDRSLTLTADLDLADVRRESMTLDVAGHYSRPDALELTVHARPRATKR